MSIRVKICGVCRPEDAEVAAACGADYIGVILAPGYGRSRTMDEAARIFEAGAGLRRVAVFVDPVPADLAEADDLLGLHVVQLHGNESPETIAKFRRLGDFGIWKVVRPRTAADLREAVERYACVVDGLVLDGSGRAAGSGAGWAGSRFPWSDVAPARSDVPRGVEVIVAGGLDPNNVVSAIACLAPDVVDVSSGVESAPGIKDPDRVRAFVAAARSAVVDGAPALPPGLRRTR